MNKGDRIYYTGDMANRAGWFRVIGPRDAAPDWFTMAEEEGGEGRTLTVAARHVGDVYRGHCDPRFVTEAAYNAFRAERLAS